LFYCIYKISFAAHLKHSCFWHSPDVKPLAIYQVHAAPRVNASSLCLYYNLCL
jgi:hypothetical protein